MAVIDQLADEIGLHVAVFAVILPGDRKLARAEAAAQPQQHRIAAVGANAVVDSAPFFQTERRHTAKRKIIAAHWNWFGRFGIAGSEERSSQKNEAQEFHRSSSTLSKSAGSFSGARKPLVMLGGHFTAAPVPIATQISLPGFSSRRAQATAQAEAGSSAKPSCARQVAVRRISSSSASSAAPPDS